MWIVHAIVCVCHSVYVRNCEKEIEKRREKESESEREREREHLAGVLGRFEELQEVVLENAHFRVQGRGSPFRTHPQQLQTISDGENLHRKTKGRVMHAIFHCLFTLRIVTFRSIRSLFSELDLFAFFDDKSAKLLACVTPCIRQPPRVRPQHLHHQTREKDVRKELASEASACFSNLF